MKRSLPRLIGVEELMEGPDRDPRDLERCLKDLEWINRFLGGYRVTLGHLSKLARGLPPPLRILDVATGYADTPRRIVHWARKRGVAVEIECLDRDGEILDLARRAGAGYPELRFTEGDGVALAYPDRSFDVVLASLVLHHLEGDAPRRFLAELYRVARHGVIVNDLRRGRWPHLVTWICFHTVRRGRFVRHDAPLSIRRGFLPGELLALAAEAGWSEPQVEKHPFFRLALVGRREAGLLQAQDRAV